MDIKQRSSHPAIDLALDTIEKGKQALVFADTKSSAEKTAEDIARILRKDAKEPKKELVELSEKIYRALPSPTKQCTRLALSIKSGIAFHHAGLVSKQRELIEAAFRNGTVSIICATPTLAFGVDTPAFRVILKSLKRFSGKWGADWIPVLEYLQMAGRAGRPNFHDTYGEAIALAKSDVEHDEIHARYIMGKPEEVFSKLAVEPVLRTYVLSLIAAGFARTKRQLTDFFSRTFWAHQYQDMLQLERIINKMLALLEKWEFIQLKKNDFVSAADMGEEPLVATMLGRRVAQLYIDPYTAHYFIKNLRKGKEAHAFALLQLISHSLEMRPLLRVRAKEQEKVQAVLLDNYEHLLEIEPNVYDPGYDEFLDSIKTTMFFCDWIDEQTEEKLLETYMIRPGEIRSKIASADWLLYTIEELCPLLEMHSLLKEIKKLRMRVQYGSREELLTLLRLNGVGRVRARKLYRNQLRDFHDLKSVDEGNLAQIVGKRTASSIKEQLGERKIVKIGQRKGQMGIEKYRQT